FAMLLGSPTLIEHTSRKCRVSSPPRRADTPEDSPDDWPSTAAHPQPTAADRNQRGIALHATGDIAGALTEFNSAIELDASLPEAYNNRAFMREVMGDIDGAMSDYDKAIMLQPEYVDAYCNRGAARHARGELAASMSDFDEALMLVPRHAAAP